MWGLIVSYQSHYHRETHASYFCKQKRHHGACIDGFYDELTFRLSKMFVNISGIADGVSVDFIGSNKALGPDANLDFIAHATP